MAYQLNANQPVGNYWIRALPSVGNDTFIGGLNSAILRYEGAPVEEPTSRQRPSANPLIETNLHPLEPIGVVSVLVLIGCFIADALIIAWTTHTWRCRRCKEPSF